MSIERKIAKKKVLKKNKNVDIRQIEIELEKIEKELENSKLKSDAPELIEFEKQLPTWLSKQFMYSLPQNHAMLDSWVDKWSSIVLNYCLIFAKHIIAVVDLKNEYPFKNLRINRQLTINQLVKIIDYLEMSKMAKWLDKEKQRAQIFFKTIEEFAEMIYQYLYDTGKIIDVISIDDFKNFGEKWSTLPEDDLRKALSILQEKGKAKPVSKKKKSFTFKY